MTVPRKTIAVAAAVALSAVGFTGARELSSSSSSSAAAACQKIGFQNGVSASMNRLRKLDPGGTNAAKTGAWDKLERTLTILVFDHDAACGGAPPVTTTQPPTTTAPAPRFAPRTHNVGATNQDPRFCVSAAFGGTRLSDGTYRDATGALYDSAMRNTDSRRDRGRIVNGLKGAESMDGLEPCDAYTHEGRTFPPYPAESFLR